MTSNNSGNNGGGGGGVGGGGGQIRTKLTNYSQLTELSPQQIVRVWNDENICAIYLQGFDRAIRSTNDPRQYLFYFGIYLQECQKEIDLISTPCYLEENFNKAGAPPELSASAHTFIYETLTTVVETLAYTSPAQTSVFAINHFYRSVLQLCRRCIELDIECFRIMEIVFGFIQRQANNRRLYDCVGKPRVSGNYNRRVYNWTPKDYGNGEMQLFLRIQELEQLKKQTRLELEELEQKQQTCIQLQKDSDEEYERQILLHTKRITEYEQEIALEAEEKANNALIEEYNNANEQKDTATAIETETNTEKPETKNTETDDDNNNNNNSNAMATATDSAADAVANAPDIASDVADDTTPLISSENDAETDANATKNTDTALITDAIHTEDTDTNADTAPTNDATADTPSKPATDITTDPANADATVSSVSSEANDNSNAENANAIALEAADDAHNAVAEAKDSNTTADVVTPAAAKTKPKPDPRDEPRPTREIFALTAEELASLSDALLATENYAAELSLMIEETNRIYEVSSYTDYPIDAYPFAGKAGEQSRSNSWFLIQNINYWGRIRGFDALITRISHAQCAVPVSDLVNLIRPVAQMRDYLNRDFFEEYMTRLQEALRLYYKELPDIVVRELNKQTVEKSLKNMHYMMNNHYNMEAISKAKETLKLQIASRQFRAPYVQAKIFGMNDINKYIELAIEKADYEEAKNRRRNSNSWRFGGAGGGGAGAGGGGGGGGSDGNSYGNYNASSNHQRRNSGRGSGGGRRNSGMSKQREQAIQNLWLDVRFLLKWLESEKVLPFILDRATTHIELVRRLGPIYQILLYTKSLDIVTHVDPLWKLTLGGQHESIRHLVYDLITESLMKGLNLDQTKHLFQQIAKTPKQEYDIQVLQLVKKITIQAFKKQEEAGDIKKSWYGLDLLWKFVQSADQTGGKKSSRLISPKVAREALNIFLELLATDHAISQRNAYMEKCIWHIQESSKVVQNLQLLQQLIQTFPRTQKTWYGSETTQKPNTQAGVIERLEKDYALIDHLLQDLAFYKGTVMSVLQNANAELAASSSSSNSSSKSLSPQSHSSSSSSSPSKESNNNTKIQTLRVDDSSFGYLEQLKIRLDFLLFLLTHSTLRLTRNQYRRIWDHLVGGALCREEMDLCYMWLLRGSIPPHFNAANDSHYKLYNQQDQRYLFENCIRRLPAAHLSESGYLLVVSFFCNVNKRAGTLSIKGEMKLLPRRAGDGSQSDEHESGNTGGNSGGGANNNSSGAASMVNKSKSVIAKISGNNLVNKAPNVVGGNSHPSDPNAPPNAGNNNNAAADANPLSASSSGHTEGDSSSSAARESPTKSTRERLSKFININNDLLNEDGTYLIDPDDHYCDTTRLRVNDYDSLDGISYFWDVVLKAKLPAVGTQAILLLNALHFYFAPRIKPKEADIIRQQHVQKCLIYLDQALKSGTKRGGLSSSSASGGANRNNSRKYQRLNANSSGNASASASALAVQSSPPRSPSASGSAVASTSVNANSLPMSDKDKIVVKRMVMLLKSFLESFLESNRNMQNLIEIEIRPDKEFRTNNFILVCRKSETFAQLRQKMLNQLSFLNTGLTIDHLIVKWQKRYTITQYEHSRRKLSKLDWSQSQVLEVGRKRYAFVRQFWRISSSQQPIADSYAYPIVSSFATPSKKELLTGFKKVAALSIFSQDQNVYNQLFPLLQSSHIGPAVWDILNLLPPSHIRVRRVLELGFENQFKHKSWDQLFDINKPYQLLYYLQIACGVLSGTEWKKEYFMGNRLKHKSQSTHLQWIQRFVDLGGFSFMCGLLFKLDLSSNKSHNKNNNGDEIARRIHVSSVAFLFQICSLLLSLDKSFQSVTSSERKVKSGSITAANDFPTIEAKLIKTALNVSQKILLWSDIAEKERRETESLKMKTQQQQLLQSSSSGTNIFHGANALPSTDSVVDSGANSSLGHIRKDLKITRQVSDFQELTRVNDLGPNGATILVDCLQIMIGCMRTSTKFVESLYKMEHLTHWLSSLLFNTQYPETRPAVSVALQMLSRVEIGGNTDGNDNTNASDVVPGSIRLLNELVKILSSERTQSQHSKEFFQLFLHVFDHVCRVYKHVNPEILLQAQSIAKQTFALLQSYSSLEKYQCPEVIDQFLLGLINILRVAIHHHLFADDPEISDLCTYIFYDCLFNVPQQGDYGAKCKATHSRRQAYGALHCMMEKYPESLAIIESLVLRDPIWNHISKQNLQKVSWSYHPSDLERFPIRYAGLKNQGATCYMNSIVQQLFVVDDFRQSILAARVDPSADQSHIEDSSSHSDDVKDSNDEINTDGNDESGTAADENESKNANTERQMRVANKNANLRAPDSVLYQVQLLFGYLMKSQKKYYDTIPLCRVLKGFDGQPLPLGEQQDVNEFCARLFDQLENNLKGTSHPHCIESAFGGTLINQMISKDSTCNHRSEREEKFHTVSLTVGNKSTLQESLDFYIEGDLLDGDNKYLCSKCDAKKTALKRTCFGRLPKYLFLHLSRFEFDFNTMRRKKVNSRLEFPEEINMKKYTKEGLALTEAENRKMEEDEEEEDNNGNGGAQHSGNRNDDAGNNDAKVDENEEEVKEPPKEEEELVFHEEEYYTFRLVGVVVHTGGAESGHYYSFAQSSDTQWWEFNDVDVTPFDANDLDEECFGGNHMVTKDDPKVKGKKITVEAEKPYNAYMLIYKQMREIQSSASKPQLSFMEEEKTLELPAPIQHTIWQENLKFLSDKNVFDFDYLTFLWQTINLASIRGQSALSKQRHNANAQRSLLNKNKSKPAVVQLLTAPELKTIADAFQALQIATLFVFEILLRAKDNGTWPKWMKLLYKMYEKNELARKWFLNKVCTSKQWFLNTMFYNSHKPARLAFGDLCLAILNFQRKYDMCHYDEFVDELQHSQKILDKRNAKLNNVDSDEDEAEDEEDENNERKNDDEDNADEHAHAGIVDGVIVIKQWPEIEKKAMSEVIDLLNADRFSCPRFIAFMFEFLHTVPQYHQHYEQFFFFLKGFAYIGFEERRFLIRIGVIRSIVGFYTNDTPILHFNRQVVGRNDQGQRQTRRIAPPRVKPVIELLSVLVRSACTDSFPESEPIEEQSVDLPPENDEAEAEAEDEEVVADAAQAPAQPQEQNDSNADDANNNGNNNNNADAAESNTNNDDNIDNTSAESKPKPAEDEAAAAVVVAAAPDVAADTGEVTDATDSAAVADAETDTAKPAADTTAVATAPKTAETAETASADTPDGNNTSNTSKDGEASSANIMAAAKKEAEQKQSNQMLDEIGAAAADPYSIPITNRKQLPYGYPPQCVINRDINKPQPIKLSDEDIRCLWNGIDPRMGNGQIQLSACEPWDVPLYVDPLPSYSVYNKYAQEQQRLNKWKKKNGLLNKNNRNNNKNNNNKSPKNNIPFPAEMQAIADKTGCLHGLSPRRLFAVNILDWLFRDRSGSSNRCLYIKEILEIFMYWSFNNARLSDIIFDYLHRKVAEEFKASHEYGPYLDGISKLLLIEDCNYQKKINTYVPKMIQLLQRCSKTDDSGTDLLLYQLNAWMIRMSFRIPLVAAHLKQNEELLPSMMEEYRKNHAVVLDANVGNQGQFGGGGGGGGGGRMYNTRLGGGRGGGGNQNRGGGRGGGRGNNSGGGGARGRNSNDNDNNDSNDNPGNNGQQQSPQKQNNGGKNSNNSDSSHSKSSSKSSIKKTASRLKNLARRNPK